MEKGLTPGVGVGLGEQKEGGGGVSGIGAYAKYIPKCSMLGINPKGGSWSRGLLGQGSWFKYKMSQEGFEPPTPWFVAMCSSPLSYKLFFYPLP